MFFSSILFLLVSTANAQINKAGLNSEVQSWRNTDLPQINSVQDLQRAVADFSAIFEGVGRNNGEGISKGNDEGVSHGEGTGQTLKSTKFVNGADYLGRLIERAGQVKWLRSSEWAAIGDVAERFHQQCRQKIRRLEQARNDDEFALERLYRSSSWHDINYALAATRYWQAWLAFYLASSATDKGIQAQQWAKAERGFKTTAVRILYPGIVYGSWLGLAYVDLASNRLEQAQRRLLLLQQALLSGGSSPLLTRVNKELSLLAIKRGELAVGSMLSSEKITADNATINIEKAFYWLQQHREKKQGAIRAAAIIKSVLAAGFFNDVMLTRLQTYREEILGQDIGIIGRLLEAEHAYAYQKYNTVVLKFRAFIDSGGLASGLDTRIYRYHYAVALQQIDLPAKALEQIKLLQVSAGINKEWQASLSKFHFSLAQQLFHQASSEGSITELKKAAQNYISANPNDKGVGGAWLMLAELADNEKQANAYLEKAALLPDMTIRSNLARLKRLSAQCHAALKRDDRTAQGELAGQFLAEYRQLPTKERQRPAIAALALQMEVIGGINPVGIVEKINRIEAKEQLEEPVRRLLFWSKLRALDRNPNNTHLLTFIDELVVQGLTAWQQFELFSFLLAKEKNGSYRNIITLADLLSSSLSGRTDNVRQLRLLQIRAYRANGQHEDAFLLAKKMIDTFPDSGNAWMAYVESAEGAGKLFQAERGWARISQASPQGSPRWLEAMLKRLELQTGKHVVRQRCLLIEPMRSYQHLLTQPLKVRFTQMLTTANCADDITRES